MRGFVIAFALALPGCSWQGSLFAPGGGPSLPPPGPNTRVIAEPNGTIIEEPENPPVETVLTGLSQAQAIRTAVRQLAR